MTTYVTNGTMTRAMTVTSQWEIGRRGKTRKKVALPVGGIDMRTLIAHLNWKAAQYAWHKTCK